MFQWLEALGSSCDEALIKGHNGFSTEHFANVDL